MEPQHSPTFYSPSMPPAPWTCYFCGAPTTSSPFSEVCAVCLTETVEEAERRRSVAYWLKKAREAADLANLYFDLAADLQAEGQIRRSA